MKPSYPIFLVDKDHWMRMIKSQDDLNGQIEKIDVEGNEYKGWDKNFLTCNLIIDGRGTIIAKVLKEDPDTPGLIKALNYFFSLRKQNVSVSIPLNLNELEDAFEKIDTPPPLIRRLKKFLRR